MKLKALVFSLLAVLDRVVFRYMVKTGFVLGALELAVDDLTTVPEPHRALYIEKDGKFRLDVTGVEDTAGLKSALEKERASAKEAQRARRELETRFAGIDPEQVKVLMSRFENDEEAKLIAAGKLDEVVRRRTDKFQTELRKQVETANGNVAAAEAKAAKFSQRVLDNHIRAAAAKVGLHSHAIEDALFRGRALFALDESGEAVQLDSDGKPVLGKDGKTPFSPVEWLEGMQESAPHWFPSKSSGGGAGGGASGAGGAKTITRAEFNALPPADKAKFAKTHHIKD